MSHWKCNGCGATIGTTDHSIHKPKTHLVGCGSTSFTQIKDKVQTELSCWEHDKNTEPVR